MDMLLTQLSERQFVAQIKRLNIEQNVKKPKQKAILNTIQKRKSLGKSSNCIRFNGNRVEKRVQRWAKGLNVDLNSLPLSSPERPSRKYAIFVMLRHNTDY